MVSILRKSRQIVTGQGSRRDARNYTNKPLMRTIAQNSSAGTAGFVMPLNDVRLIDDDPGQNYGVSALARSTMRPDVDNAIRHGVQPAVAANGKRGV